MLRSKYAKAQDPTFVELTFEYDGKTYTVRRNPEYERAKARGSGTTKQSADAILTYPDGHVATKLKEVDSGTLIKTFESIAGAYDAHSIMVNVTGGEPLLRKDLFSVMDKVHQLGFPWGIVTNASLITDETIQSMKKTGMRTISISIDDLFEAHERMRQHLK